MTYTQTQIHEAIEVIAHFKEMDIVIVKFRWNNTVFKVTKIPNKWKVQNGEDFTTHFSVICESEDIIAELCYHHKDFKWELIQYDSLNS